jgi:hypothetical protein
MIAVIGDGFENFSNYVLGCYPTKQSRRNLEGRAG